MSTAERAERADWVDTAKGMGIVLVVVGHAIGGLHDAGLVAPAHGLNTLNYLIYVFHMPLFFLLGGLFVPRRVEVDSRSFASGLVRRLVLPYFLWSAIQLAVIHLAGAAVNNPYPLTLQRLLALLWQPTSQYWYLHALFLMHLAAMLLYRRQGATGLFLASLTALGAKALFDLPEVLLNVCRFFAFYAAGVAMGARIARGEAFGAGLLTTAAAAAGWVILALASMHRGVGYWDVAALPAATLGAIAWIGLAQTAPLRRNALLRYLGRHSMPIFLMHVLFTAGGRIVLAGLMPWGDGVPLFVCLVLLGVAGPLLVFEVSRRLKLAPALGFT